MRIKTTALCAIALAGVALLLAGCDYVDEGIMNNDADFSVSIDVPYATATPLPEYMDVPDPIVIDSDGKVTVNDKSLVSDTFRSTDSEAGESKYSQLVVGSTGIAVQSLQARLKQLGYLEAEPTGIYDSATETAVEKFELTFGTMQTGVATERMQMKLFAETAPVYGSQEYTDAVESQYRTLQRGDAGSEVFALQSRLRNLGYPIADVSGVYDSQTERAVMLFYKNYGLSSGKTASVSMQKELYSETALVYTAKPEDEEAIEMEDETDPTLVRGDAGDKVTTMQTKLIELGFLPFGGDSSLFDEATELALMQFQQSAGIAQSGELDDVTRSLLYSENAIAYGNTEEAQKYKTLSIGDTGDEVMALQRRLVELGYAEGSPSGSYDNATVSCIRLFQRYNGFEENGIANTAVQIRLFDSATTDRETSYAYYHAQNQEVETFITEEDDEIYAKLELGSKGSDVSELQSRLKKLGFKCDVTGVYDDATASAVEKFQNIVGVPKTGEATASFQRYIYSDAAPNSKVKRFHKQEQSYIRLAPGDEGEEVAALQERLGAIGMLSMADIKDNNGIYNDATREAVEKAQKKMGYPNPDGIAGIEFQCFIYTSYGKMLRNR